MNLKNVIKRSGLTVDYDRSKIYNAIAGAAKEIPDSMTDEEKESITNQVENYRRRNTGCSGTGADEAGLLRCGQALHYVPPAPCRAP